MGVLCEDEIFYHEDCTRSIWSCEFATLTNRKLVGLKVTSYCLKLTFFGMQNFTNVTAPYGSKLYCLHAYSKTNQGYSESLAFWICFQIHMFINLTRNSVILQSITLLDAHHLFYLCQGYMSDVECIRLQWKQYVVYANSSHIRRFQ